MQKKVIISVAPVGTWGAGEGNPLSPQDVSAQVIECAKAGAAMVHMHCRDETGALTTDLTTFNRTVELIKASCDIIIEASTGGISSIHDLAGKTVVTTQGTTGERLFSEYNKNHSLQATLIPGKSDNESFALLEAGKAIAFLTDDVILYSQRATSKTPEAYAISRDPLIAA